MKKIILTLVVALITFGGYYVLTRPPVIDNSHPTTTVDTSNGETTTPVTTDNDSTATTVSTVDEIEYLGSITIVVIDESETVVINDHYQYLEGDTLFSILNTHYELGCANRSYQLSDVCEPVSLGSRVLLKIDDIVTNWSNSYLAIYIDDIYSVKGLDYILLEDGSTYKFVYKGV